MADTDRHTRMNSHCAAGALHIHGKSGELPAVYYRGEPGSRVDADAEHARRMVAHHYAGRPESRYRYDDTGQVTEQSQPGGAGLPL